MKDFKILAVNGQLGYGFPANVFYEGMKRKPDLVGVDGGSNDGGPYYLGSGASHCDSEAIKRDLRIVLPAVREAGIPFVIGSACTAGGNPHVDTALSIIRDVLDEMGWNAKIAVVRAEIPADFVRGKLRLGKVTPIDGAPPLTEKDIDESDRIVGQMGIEPVIRALDTGADIVLAGRACDTAVYAALPMRLGYDPALCQHASKVIECGAYCCSPAGAAESILAIIRENDFILETLNPDKKVLPLSVTAHSLYEERHPSRFYEPDGLTDCASASFEALEGSDRAVRVSGTTYVRNADGKMTLKIEGAAKEGYRCVCIVGVRDRYMIANLDSALQKVTDFVKATAGSPGEAGYRLRFRVYGKNAVMGDLEYLPCTAHEVGILIDVLADDQKLANTICALARSNILHVSFPERRSTGGNVAMVFSPHDVPMGPVYRFSAYHIVEDLSTADFEKLFPVEVLEARS